MSDEFIGSSISLISNYDIRYEGVLCHLSPQDSTLGLKNVRSHGTEGRKKDGRQIPPGDKVYEYILFRGSDIKDLQVKSSLPTQKEEQVPNDPAIIQSRGSAGPSSSLKSYTVGGGSSAHFSSFQEHGTSANTASPGTGPSYQSGLIARPGSSSVAARNADLASSAIPLDTRGYSGTSYPGTVQNYLQSTVIPVSTTVGLPYPSGVTDNIPSVTFPYTIPFNKSPALAAEQYPISSDKPCSLPGNIPVSPFYSSYPDMAGNEALVLGKSASDSVAPCSVHTSPFLSSSIPDSMAVPLSKLKPTLPQVDELRQPRQPLSSSLPFTHPYEIDRFALNPVSANVSTSLAPTLGQQTQLRQPSQPLSSSVPFTQPYDDKFALNPVSANVSTSLAPTFGQQLLLPFPLTGQQHSSPEYTEEFDFEAMNEKFKKEEVWGYLGGARTRIEAEETAENAFGQNFGNRSGYISASKPELKPAYKKDEFFDTLSSNVRASVPRKGHRFSERMKHDTETFGHFGHMPYRGRGFYHHGRGHGWNYQL